MDKETYEALRDIVNAVRTGDPEGALNPELSKIEAWMDEVAKDYDDGE